LFSAFQAIAITGFLHPYLVTHPAVDLLYWLISGMESSLVSGFFLAASRFARAVSRRLTVARYGFRLPVCPYIGQPEAIVA